jgi:hypothetical protein
MVTIVSVLLVQMRIRGGGRRLVKPGPSTGVPISRRNARNGRVPEKRNVNRGEEISGLNVVRDEVGVCTVQSVRRGTKGIESWA